MQPTKNFFKCWVPKCQKTPFKVRFIVAAALCSLKPLSEAVTSASKYLINKLKVIKRNLCSFFLERELKCCGQVKIMKQYLLVLKN